MRKSDMTFLHSCLWDLGAAVYHAQLGVWSLQQGRADADPIDTLCDTLVADVKLVVERVNVRTNTPRGIADALDTAAQEAFSLAYLIRDEPLDAAYDRALAMTLALRHQRRMAEALAGGR
jgi:hypothetical protein